MSGENWIKVGPFPGSMYAEMVTEVLRNRKIPHRLSQDWLSGAYGAKGVSPIADQTYIFVPEDVLEAVNEIVATMFPDAEADETDDDASTS
ncbi:MAG: hypothetical protein AAFP70_21915 [Calditrichota bacterium]